MVLFLKGSIEKPFDGYQRKAIEILREEKVRFTYFNVMNDPDVREILKEYSRFTAYPQIYINEKFVGGLSFLEEGAKLGGLTHCVPSTEVMLPMKEKILQLIKKSRLMCFMRGSIDFPRCI